MNAFYLISIIVGIAAQNVVKKNYADKVRGNGVYFFSALCSLAAMVFFTVSAIADKGMLEWEMGVLPYSLLFALFYAIGTIFCVVAVSCGPLSITTLIIQYSLMIPTLYGLVFLNDPISAGLIPGLVLLGVSLVFINKKEKNVKFSFKWIVSVFLAFLGNGMCSVAQKMQQNAFDGKYKDEFMIAALLIVVIIVGIFVILKERKEIGTYVKAGWGYALICGIFNGMVNLFVMILSGLMAVSLMFPLISAGGIIVIYLISRLFYKEKLTKLQFIGFVLGIGSVVLLNI